MLKNKTLFLTITSNKKYMNFKFSYQKLYQKILLFLIIRHLNLTQIVF